MSDKHASQQLVDDLKSVLHQAEDLMSATAGSRGEKLEAARRKLADGIASVRAQQERLQDKMSDALRASGRLVKEHPYETAAGGGLALALLVVGVLWLIQRSR